MSKRTLVGWFLLACLSMVVMPCAAADSEPSLWFGFGGSSAGLFFPDLGGLNAFLDDHGHAPFGEMMPLSGGRVRGGSFPGLSLGGLGWGGEMASVSEDRTAVLEVGFGGIEAGIVVGGNRRSLLTFGFVLGGGGTELTLVEDTGASNGTCGAQGPRGIVIEPTVDVAYGAFTAIAPFVSFQVQPLRILGFELHLGYLFPLFDMTWGDPAVADAPLGLTGPVVNLSVSWGAIGRPFARPRIVEETETLTAELVGPCVQIDGAVGEVLVETAGEIQTGSAATVRVVAVKRAGSEAALDEIEVLVEPTRCGLWIHVVGPDGELWNVDLLVTVPAGVELSVHHGVGSVRVQDIVGTASIDLGIGEIVVDGFRGSELTIDGGIGEVRVERSEAVGTDIGWGTGSVVVDVSDAVPADVVATVGIGRISIDSLVGHDTAHAGGFGAKRRVESEDAARRVSIDLGIGEVSVNAGD